MGYKRKTLHITFEDKPGLEIYARSLSVGNALDLMREFGEIDLTKVTAMPREQLEKLFAAFVKRVVSWSLEEDDDSPLPVTLAAFMEWDLDEAVEIFYAWLQRAVSVSFPTAVPAPAPAAGTTASGEVEASIPMVSPSGTS